MGVTSMRHVNADAADKSGVFDLKSDELPCPVRPRPAGRRLLLSDQEF
jgi:hypothetical protein